jgi:hypothetical protein
MGFALLHLLAADEDLAGQVAVPVGGEVSENEPGEAPPGGVGGIGQVEVIGQGPVDRRQGVETSELRDEVRPAEVAGEAPEAPEAPAPAGPSYPIPPAQQAAIAAGVPAGPGGIVPYSSANVTVGSAHYASDVHHVVTTKPIKKAVHR